MKAQPLKRIAAGYKESTPKNATHIRLNFPSHSGYAIVPISLKQCKPHEKKWTWNGDVDKPTLTPSFLTRRRNGLVCHSFVTGGKAKFLSDCSHNLVNQTVDMLDV